MKFGGRSQRCLIETMRNSVAKPKGGLGFLGGSDSKESTCKAGEPGSIPGSGRPLEEEMATHSSILAWRIPWTEEIGSLSRKSRTLLNYQNLTSHFQRTGNKVVLETWAPQVHGSSLGALLMWKLSDPRVPVQDAKFLWKSIWLWNGAGLHDSYPTPQ